MKKIIIKEEHCLENWGALGRAFPKKRTIYVDPRQPPKCHLDTAVHEVIHVEFPNWKEKRVANTATSIAKVLWRMGYRRARC